MFLTRTSGEEVVDGGQTTTGAVVESSTLIRFDGGGLLCYYVEHLPCPKI